MSEFPSGPDGYYPGPKIPRRGSSTVHLLARHREIIRLTILGWSPTRIAASVDMTPQAIRSILRAPLVQAELERLQDEADRMTINVPLRSQIEGELRGATVQALRLNRRIMRDPSVDARTRSNVAKHFMDRVLFDIDSDTGEKNTGYREILRRLDEVDKSLGRGVWFNAEPSSDAIDARPGPTTPVNGHGVMDGPVERPSSVSAQTSAQTGEPNMGPKPKPEPPDDDLTSAIRGKMGIEP